MIAILWRPRRTLRSSTFLLAPAKHLETLATRDHLIPSPRLVDFWSTEGGRLGCTPSPSSGVPAPVLDLHWPPCLQPSADSNVLLL